MFNKKLILFFTICILFILLGCEREWYFSLLDVTNYKYPKFCVSSNETCKGDGVSFASLNIDEVNENGVLIKPMWVITAVERKNIKIVEYGKEPEGFRENSKAIPLEIGKYYSVNSSFYFKFIKIEGNIKVLLFNQEKFNKKKS
jgi:hypothetical protein